MPSHFYPRSPCGERRQKQPTQTAQKPFLSTLSLRRATCSDHVIYVFGGISIHALLAESDARISTSQTTSPDFYPRSPCGERLSGLGRAARPGLFLSTLSLRRATCARGPLRAKGPFLSTLSLRRATPASIARAARCIRFLSTLSLRRATTLVTTHALFCAQFLSTLSLRRATHPGQPVRGLPGYFYPRSPCGERHNADIAAELYCSISIHALLAESDPPVLRLPHPLWLFLSTLSLRRATVASKCSAAEMTYFYPRSPCGERQIATASARLISLFLSTLSLRRATAANIDVSCY